MVVGRRRPSDFDRGGGAGTAVGRQPSLLVALVLQWVRIRAFGNAGVAVGAHPSFLVALGLQWERNRAIR